MMTYKRCSSMRRSITTQKKVAQPTKLVSRLPRLDPKLVPKIPDELRQKWIRNPDIGLFSIDDENLLRPSLATRLANLQEEPDDMPGPSTSATPEIARLSLDEADGDAQENENWLMDEDLAVENVLDLSDENAQLEKLKPKMSIRRSKRISTFQNVSDRGKRKSTRVSRRLSRLSLKTFIELEEVKNTEVREMRKSTRSSRRFSRLSLRTFEKLEQQVKNEFVQNEEADQKEPAEPVEPAVTEAVSDLVDQVVLDEIRQKRAERKKIKGAREVVRYDPITPKVTRSGRKFGNRTSIIIKKRQRMLRRISRVNRQSIQPPVEPLNEVRSKENLENDPEEIERPNEVEFDAPIVEPVHEMMVEERVIIEPEVDVVEPVTKLAEVEVMVEDVQLLIEARIENPNIEAATEVAQTESEQPESRLKVAEVSIDEPGRQEIPLEGPPALDVDPNPLEPIIQITPPKSQRTSNAQRQSTLLFNLPPEDTIAYRRPRRASMYTTKISIHERLEQEQLIERLERENRKTRKRKSVALKPSLNDRLLSETKDGPSTSKTLETLEVLLEEREVPPELTEVDPELEEVHQDLAESAETLTRNEIEQRRTEIEENRPIQEKENEENSENFEEQKEGENEHPVAVELPVLNIKERRGRRRNSIYPRELLKTVNVENLEEPMDETQDNLSPDVTMELKNTTNRKGKTRGTKTKKQTQRASEKADVLEVTESENVETGEDRPSGSTEKPIGEAFVTNRKKPKKGRIIREEDYHPSLRLPAPAKSVLRKEDQPKTQEKTKYTVQWADENNAPLQTERRISEVPEEYRFRKSTFRASNFHRDPYE